jgi:L-lactate dehydrogenase complex protein LldF
VVGGEFHEMLRCIRCGACMNHCPVYQTIGGHAYGWVYPGPMGSVLTPLYAGIENAIDLPHAATLCNQCGVVCPVKIPLPDLMRKLREKQTDAGLRPLTERIGLRVWAWVAQRPALYGLGARFGARYLKWLAGEDKSIRLLPAAQEWTRGRDFPAPQGKTFRELYARRRHEFPRRHPRPRARGPASECRQRRGRPGSDDGGAGQSHAGPQPAVAKEPRALLERFRLKSEQASSTVDIVATDADVPAAIAKYLAAMKLPTTAVAWASLAALDWAGAGLKVETRGARDADLVGITGCFCAVAETGTLMMTSSPDTPAAVSLLPETHIAVVRAARIVPYMEDAWNLARAELGSLPRAVNFISGPSRTGDIEQTIVLGAHGPYRVHLVIVEG